MISTKDVFYKMTVIELNNIIKIFELNVGCRKKENIVDIIYEYMKNHIIYIFREHIVLDELDLLRKVCDNNCKISYEEADLDLEHVQSLLRIGLIYINEENTSIVIPQEFQETVKSCLDDEYVINSAKRRTEIVNMVKRLLDLYGVFHLELLEDYVMDKIGLGYRIHITIEFIRKYNMRNNFYYEDDDCFYYNLKITDRKSIKMRILEMAVDYKYYEESEMKNILNRRSQYEKDVKIILNRIYKNLKVSNEIMNDIRFMIIEGKTSEVIGCILKEKVKRLSNLGLKSIVKHVDSMRRSYIIWGLKGYYLDEIDKKIRALYNG